MIMILLLLVGVVLGLLGSTLLRRRVPVSSGPMLTELRETLEAMERDYRLRVATEELTRDAHPRLGRPES